PPAARTWPAAPRRPPPPAWRHRGRPTPPAPRPPAGPTPAPPPAPPPGAPPSPAPAPPGGPRPPPPAGPARTGRLPPGGSSRGPGTPSVWLPLAPPLGGGVGGETVLRLSVLLLLAPDRPAPDR